MEDQYTVSVQVTAPNGSVPFAFTTLAFRHDLFAPGAATPGTKPVFDFLLKAAE